METSQTENLQRGSSHIFSFIKAMSLFCARKNDYQILKRESVKFQVAARNVHDWTDNRQTKQTNLNLNDL